MGETDIGAVGARSADEPDSDSTAKPGFLSRLFRREPEDALSARDSRVEDEAQAGATEMILNVRRIRKMRVGDVSVPRAEIVAIEAGTALVEVVAAFQDSEMTRLPVYAGALDHPQGLVHLKDLALRHGFGADSSAFDLAPLLRPLLYVPPSMPIGVLLQKMRAERIHMALIIDEYGGVDGLVTIEDLLEQIVGDIGDEHDDAEDSLWSRESEDVFLAEGRMDIEDFEAEAGVRLADPDLAEEVDTLGGLMFRLAGRVPVEGEVVVHPGGHEFEVLDADARKVKRLRIRIRRPGAAGLSAQAAE